MNKIAGDKGKDPYYQKVFESIIARPAIIQLLQLLVNMVYDFNRNIIYRDNQLKIVNYLKLLIIYWMILQFFNSLQIQFIK